jgi:uncharacterized RDD family membrane protein YckC
LLEPKRLLASKPYWDPAGNYVARRAPPWRRAAAAAVDWMLCYVAFLLVSIPLGGLQALGATSWEEGDLGGWPGHVLFVVTQVLTVVPAVVYFALLLPTSHTLGMRALDIRVVSKKTGRAPSYFAAIPRAIAATALAASVYATLMVASAWSSPGDFDDASSYALAAARIGAAIAAASALVMIVTPARRSLVDRLFRTAVIDELEAIRPILGPWGPLQAFDLAARTRSSPETRGRVESAG